MLKRTKVIATIGPAMDAPGVLEQTLLAGVDVVRLNLSHGKPEEHIQRVNNVRQCAQKTHNEVGVLVDLQGPKIRIACFKDNKVELTEGQKFVLDAELPDDDGDETVVGVDYKALYKDVATGDTLLLDDGRIELQVVEIDGKKIICSVEVGGGLSNHKGINRRGGGLSATALTDKDKSDIKLLKEVEADYLALSFPRDAADIEQARALLNQTGSNADLIAKIERAEAIENIEEIIAASDGIMVARGDLGVEIGDAQLPAAQKHLIRRARSLNKVVITATQMMESMITSPIPTRAEVSDVANAVLDGTDAVMLSAETATGAYPTKVVEAVERICLAAEQDKSTQVSHHRLEQNFDRVDEAIAMASMYTANHTDVNAIISFTESGATPLWMSRINTSIPIFGFTRHVSTQRKMMLYRGVTPILFDPQGRDQIQLGKEAIDELLKRDVVKKGDWVIITRGDIFGVHGGTNRMKIVRAGYDLGA